MSSTSNSRQDVIDALQASRRKWPFSTGHDTVNDDPWPLAWDAAAFIQEWFKHNAHNDVEEAICHVPINADQFGYNTAEWHSQHSPDALLKAHVLRIVKGWGGEKALYDYLTGEPSLVCSLGFSDGLPSQTTLWRAWNDNRLTEEHQEVLTTIGQIVVDVAREHDIPAPDEVFHPNPSVDAPDSVEQDDSTVRDRTIVKTREVWKHAKPDGDEALLASEGRQRRSTRKLVLGSARVHWLTRRDVRRRRQHGVLQRKPHANEFKQGALTVTIYRRWGQVTLVVCTVKPRVSSSSEPDKIVNSPTA